MNTIQSTQLLEPQNQNLPAEQGPRLSAIELFEQYRAGLTYWYYYMLLRQMQERGLKPTTIKIQEDSTDERIKKEEAGDEEDKVYFENGRNGADRKTRNNRSKQGGKIKKRKKENDRNTQKNLLVHLKLWLQRFIEEKGRIQPRIKKEFERIFSSKSHKTSKEVYMNLGLLQKVLQNEELRPCLKQFFEHRILRYLMSSNIQNKICIVKYVPILLKKYTQGRCQSLKS